ncbi:MAG: hypothetical protein EOO91_01395 [Pedobacter sp.]|nr:MAG: hypothetical protein EOO91_01395 [Pedobacter sp.]
MFVLDACTIINILHIDVDDFLNKKLEPLKFTLTQCVADEVREHAFDKFERYKKYPVEEDHRIRLKMNYFRPRIYYPDLDCSEDVKADTGYSKSNGEFHSVVLSYYFRFFEETKVVFYTEDSPAKSFFEPYFNDKEIGTIEDLVDLLLFFYKKGDFSATDLKKYLSSLFYELASVIKNLEKDIYGFSVPKMLIRDRQFRNLFDKTKIALKQLDLNELIVIYNYLKDNKKYYSSLYLIFKKYREFFEQNISSAYFEKIRRIA